jgi:hypothetical protein
MKKDIQSKAIPPGMCPILSGLESYLQKRLLRDKQFGD